MNDFGLSFHHFGLAVRHPADAFTYLRGLGYTEGAELFDPLQCVNLAMRHHAEMPDVEVVWPGDQPSPIDTLIKRNGSLIYHQCYVCHDVANALASIDAAGLRVMPVSLAKPAALFGGTEVSFYNIVNVGVVELIHGDPA